MTDDSDGWPFLVARGRRSGYRTLLAPGFLVDENLHHILAQSTGTSGMGSGGTRVIELDDARAGPISIGYTSRKVGPADVGVAGEPPTDEHGRPLEIVYGIVSRNRISGPLATADLEAAGEQALESYRSFLACEDDHGVQVSAAFALHTPIDSRPASGPTRAGPDDDEPVDPAATDTQRAVTPAATDRQRAISPAATDTQRARWPRLGRGASSALMAAILMVSVGVVLAVSPGASVVRVYSSLPLQGPQRTRSQDIVRGIRLALKHARGRAGKFEVRYESLDDSTAAARGWAPQAVTANASRAARDDDAVVYIGELDSAASAVSIPILSRARLAQISPANTAVGLTTNEPGAGKGEPGRYYVNGFRNYVRIVPRDTLQGEALAAVMRQDGCTRVALVHDRDRRDSGLARSIGRSMRERGLRQVLDEPVAARSAAYRRSLAKRVARVRADCVVVSAEATSGAVAIFEALAGDLPRARLYGSDGVAVRSFTDPAQGGLPGGVAARVKLTLPALGAKGLGVAGRRFLAEFAREYPANRNPDPYAINGYEAMSLALDAIERAGTVHRRDIVKALFDTADRRGAIGTYSIDDNGDTTLAQYGLFAIRNGALVFERAIKTSG